MAGHLMIKRDFSVFSWNLSFLVKLFVFRKISRFSQRFSAFIKPLGFLLINGRPLNEKRDFSVFSWNLSFLVKPLVFRRNLSFLAKLLGFPENPSVFFLD